MAKTKTKRVTWDELATIYDKHHRGRKARTLKMDTIFDWAVSRQDLFKKTKGGRLMYIVEDKKKEKKLKVIKLTWNQRCVLKAVKECCSGQLADIIYHVNMPSIKRIENALRALIAKGCVTYSYPHLDKRIYETTRYGEQILKKGTESGH